ncbi:hypothetical protein PS874_01927 [Pseudomonas fluorescens]|nr:hypothetical protein PS874_01927 [Pseudomonas fluorescens]
MPYARFSWCSYAASPELKRYEIISDGGTRQPISYQCLVYISLVVVLCGCFFKKKFSRGWVRIMSTIFTVNSRSHVMLEVMRDHFEISAQQMHLEIRSLHQELVRVLESKGVSYNKLRAALVPSMDRQEATLIFDSTVFETEFYGRETFNYVMPLLEPRSTQSILVGDLRGNNKSLVFDILRESMVLSRSFTLKHHSLLFGVYLNNLSDAALFRLHKGLADCPAYLGYIPTTFGSRAKTYISFCMASFVVKVGRTLIVAHEDERSNNENINITFYPLESFGYVVTSLQQHLFSIFLAFKIERPLLKGFEVDAELALNSISTQVVPYEDFSVILDEAKYGYLIREKLGKLKMAGVDAADREGLESLIKSKISASYIYNLAYLEEHDVMKFNIMLEFERHAGYPARMTASLEYLPTQRVLRVITLH